MPVHRPAAAYARSRARWSARCTHYNGLLVWTAPTGRVGVFYGGDLRLNRYCARSPRGRTVGSAEDRDPPGGPVSEQELESPASKGRMSIYYVVLAVITAVVAVLVISAGKDEKAQKSIAGGYDATSPVACLGAPPPKPTGAPLPVTAPSQPAV